MALEGLRPGEVLERSQVHHRYGGRLQGRICPSATSSAVLIFLDPWRSAPAAIHDGVDARGHLFVHGEGDQRVQGNKAVLNHTEDGRTLEVFALREDPSRRGQHQGALYLGTFYLAAHHHGEAQHRDQVDGAFQTIVFELVADGEVDASGALAATDLVPVDLRAEPLVTEVPLDLGHSAGALLTHVQDLRDHERAAVETLQAYRDHLLSLGRRVGALRVVAPGEAMAVHVDLFDHDAGEVVVAARGVTRDRALLAAATARDLADLLTPARAGAPLVVLTQPPRAAVAHALGALGVDAAWPVRGGAWRRRSCHEMAR